MSRRNRNGKKAASNHHIGNGVLPTPERAQHNPIEVIEHPIADDEGRPSRPYLAVDILGWMHRRGAITAGMRQAGEDFRTQFAAAQLAGARAMDLAKPLETSAREYVPSTGVERARKRVWSAIVAVGGIASRHHRTRPAALGNGVRDAYRGADHA